MGKIIENIHRPFFAQNSIFLKLLQANLAYIAHPWLVPRSQHVYKVKPNIYLHYFMW
jgi:hypothetical protein